MNKNRFQVLFVCTGNTCRSPLAEGILKNLLKSKGIEHIQVSSAGTAGLDDLPASENAVLAAKVWDVDISEHRSRPINSRIIESSDLILAMSPEHVNYILKLSPAAKNRTYLIKGYPTPFSPSQEGVRDPIGGPLDFYNQTYLELDEILRRIEGDIIDISNRSGD
ncbi:MAG: low molecular weight protein arginine phosphatase [Candidatus Zixiibacteriota bacterium]|nr:MAG: low molecular weight protein arginine phosphatase [candidate division Zixibacteria bacterium]